MIDLDELNKMLDDALESESAESLSLWMEEQIKADREAGIIRNAEFGILHSGVTQNALTESQESVIVNGIHEDISYQTSDVLPKEFEIDSESNYNFAA